MIDSEEQKYNIRHNDEINLIELFNILWNSKLKIILITSIFGIFSIYYALSIPNQYKASTTLLPIQSSTSGPLSGALGQLGGIASIAGMNIGGGQVDEAQIAIEVMQSWSFIEKFIFTNKISVELSAAKKWDEASNKIVIDEAIYNTKTNEWLETPPTSWSLFQLFAGMLNVSKNRDTGLVTVSIEYFSPHIAKKWLDLYIDEINTYMQNRKVDDVNRNLKYLEAEIEKTANAEMRQVFYTLIEEQTKNKMLASVNPEYAFKAVNPSMIPQEKSQPRRSFICIFITLFGGFFSVISVLFMHYLRSAYKS